MNTDLKQRIETMRAKLDERAPVVEVSAASQLFVTPEPACKRLVTLAEVKNTDYILEPSAGTGAILRAIKHAAPSARCDAVELNAALVGICGERFLVLMSGAAILWNMGRRSSTTKSS